jgi:methylphosphotriester-DNA--protein-cysteine methyltransferase
MGQPPKFVDWSKLDFSCKLGGSLSITAGYCEVSEDTIERAVQKNKGMTFREYRDQLMSTSRLKLIQKAMSKAFDGDNTMLIWCMKNQCGWSDKIEHGLNENKKQILLKYSIDPKTVGPKPDKGTTE